MALASLSEARDACNLQDDDTGKDAWLTTALDAATTVIENIVGPLESATRTWVTDGGEASVLLPERATAVTSVTVDGAATEAYTADLDAGVVHYGTGASAGLSLFPAGRANVIVAYEVGEDDVPPVAAQACVELVRHWFQNGQQGQRPGFGGETIPEQAFPGSGYAVPKRVTELLQSLASRRLRGA